MRLWSLHPRHLDRAGLVAGWREALLAQAVLAGNTKGYRQHPQLIRFRQSASPLQSVGTFLLELHAEAVARGYRFDHGKILEPVTLTRSLTVTQGQLDFEWAHLGAKLTARSAADATRWEAGEPTAHPLFTVVPGPIEPWERA